MIDFGYVNFNNIEEKAPELVPTVELDMLDTQELEELFHRMSPRQLKLVVCLYLGMTPEEITKLMGYANVWGFYTAQRRLREYYREQKR